MRAAATGLFLSGMAVVALWIHYAGGPDLLASVGRVPVYHVALLVGLTAACVGLRFIRWQYLLRRMGVMVPTRGSLVIYLGSLVGIATPAYLGETVRTILLRRAYGISLRTTLAAWVVERLLDFAGIALIGLVAVTGGSPGVGALAVAALIAAIWPAYGGVAAPAALGRPGVVLPVLGLTVLAWLPAAVILVVAARGMGLPLETADGIRVFAAATFGGGLSLMPAGLAATGSLGIVQLQDLGLQGTEAVALVSIFRLATVGITLAVGGMFLLVALRGPRTAVSPEQHFDDIAGEYLDQFTPHIWDLLLERKTRLICSALPARENLLGLDLGCGLGHQALALGVRGHRVVGLDPAYHLVHNGRAAGLQTVTGSGLELPFADGSFDFVYTVGVLHHLTGAGQQEAAIREVERVLRPGGAFIVHETNPRNPIFRLYMGYVFPILRSIDEGVERWLHPARWSRAGSLDIERVEHFTFLPDFLPRPLLRFVLPLERRLERSRLRNYSVHYMAVLRKRPAPDGSVPARVPSSAVAV